MSADLTEPVTPEMLRAGRAALRGSGRLLVAAYRAMRAAAPQAAEPAADDPDAAAERRLTAMLTEAGLSRHPAMDDLARLVFACRERDRLRRVLASARESNNPATALAINFLVAAGYVKQEKADEAFRLACASMARERAALARERAATTEAPTEAPTITHTA